MIQFFPFLAWIAVVTSVVLLAVLWLFGELGSVHGTLVLGGVVLAAYWQFFAASAGIAAAGLGLQTCVAIYLLIRWKLE